MPRRETYAGDGSIVEIVDTRTVEEARAALRQSIDALRDAKIERVFVFQGIPIQLDARARINLIALGAAAAARLLVGDTTAFRFRDEANVVHRLAPQQMLVLAMAVLDHVSAIQERAWTLKDDLAVKSDLANLDAMDITKDWPP